MATQTAIDGSSHRSLPAMASGEESAAAGACVVNEASVSGPRVAPLSFEQERLWFLDQLEPGLPVYNIPRAFHLRGSLDAAVLGRALDEIVRRHESLRTTFGLVDGAPQQVVAPSMHPRIDVRDLRAIPEPERTAEAARQAASEAATPFDLERGPLLRTVLLQLGAEEYLLVITMHHIVSEGGWSMNIFLHELGVLYAAFRRGERSPLLPLAMQYADYSVWQRKRLEGELLERELAYWRAQLAGASALQHLPADRPRPPRQSYRGSYAQLRLSPQLSERILSISRASGVTVAMTLLAAWVVVVRRYTQRDDILLWMPVAGRTHLRVEGLIGFFVNTLALRVNTAGDPSFRELLDRVREVSVGALGHLELPFARLVEILRPERVRGRTPPLQLMFAPQPVSGPPLMLEDVDVEAASIHTGTATSDLTLYSWEEREGIRLTLDYCTDLFDPERIHRMLGHYRTVLQGIVADASRRLSELPLLTDEERYHLLVEWSCAEHTLPSLSDRSDGSRVYVLDEQLHPVPVGVPGEIFLGRGGVAGGAAAEGARATEQLVPDPFSSAPGAMLLRTGERASWMSDGTLSIIEKDRAIADRPAGDTADTPMEPPLSALEWKLSEIWKEILGIEPIGVNESFFELGGHSLMAVRLFSAIEERLCPGRHLPLATLLQAPTISQLAAFLEADEAAAREAGSSQENAAESGRWASLVPISESGDRPPLVCVHGSGGNVLGYRRLAQRLGPDQPVYGLQARGLDGVTAPATRIEEMAASYVAELRAAWPDGPYALCGLSFGGTVAFEMARLLRAQGQSVALIALFDSCPAHTDWLIAGDNFYQRIDRLAGVLHCHLRNMRSLPMRGVLRYIRAQLRTQRHRIRGMVWRHRYRRHRKAPGANQALPQALQDVEQACEMAFREYQPRPYSGRVTLFRAAIRSAGEGDDPLFGWGRLAAGGVDVRDVPGSHVTMLNEPHVDQLAEQLGDCLAAAFAAHRPSSGYRAGRIAQQDRGTSTRSAGQ